MAPRALVAWLTWPGLMVLSVLVAAWGLRRGFAPAGWVVAIGVGHALVVAALEQVLPRRPDANLLRDRQSLNDLGHVLACAAARPLAAVVALGLVVLLAGEASPRGWWPREAPFPAQLVAALLLWSFLSYWLHRALHRFEWLWRFHAIHHDTRQLHLLKAGRQHFGEEIVRYLIVPAPVLLLGVPAEVLLWVGLWTVFDTNLRHSNLDQRFPGWFYYLVPTVPFHALHHAEERRLHDSNFGGIVSIWDYLFGTFAHPDRNAVRVLGLEGDPVPSGFVAQLAHPFHRSPVPTVTAGSNAGSRPAPTTR